MRLNQVGLAIAAIEAVATTIEKHGRSLKGKKNGVPLQLLGTGANLQIRDRRGVNASIESRQGTANGLCGHETRSWFRKKILARFSGRFRQDRRQAVMR